MLSDVGYSIEKSGQILKFRITKSEPDNCVCHALCEAHKPRQPHLQVNKMSRHIKSNFKEWGDPDG